jgi:hypothetical protein
MRSDGWPGRQVPHVNKPRDIVEIGPLSFKSCWARASRQAFDKGDIAPRLVDDGEDNAVPARSDQAVAAAAWSPLDRLEEAYELPKAITVRTE